MTVKPERIEAIFANVCKKKVLVIGDYMLDVYHWGSVDRISPEAPVPVVSVNRTSHHPGGAANVVHNLHSLGVIPVPIGVVGDDANGKQLCRLLNEMGIDSSGIEVDSSRSTTAKTRIVANHQQVVRADYESIRNLSPEVEEKLLSKVQDQLDKADGVVFEDYNKGVITEKVAQECITQFVKRDVFVSVDPKQKNFHYFKGASVIKPNRKEAMQMVQHPLQTPDQVFSAAKQIQDDYNLKAVLITLGERGMALYEGNGEFTELASVAREVFDVTGAGDTVISSFTAFATAGATLKEAAFLANQAASLVVGEVGTAAVTLSQIKETIR